MNPESVETALRLAREAFQQRDKASLSREAGVPGLGEDQFELEFLGARFQHDGARGGFVDEAGSPPSPKQETLLLHYLCRADGTPVAGKLIGFAEVPGAGLYDGVFEGRIRGRLAGTFGSRLDAFADAASKLGATRASFGDVSATIRVFPRVSITLVLWRGDEEFKPRANLLFDTSIAAYLSVEDIVVSCEQLLSRLTAIAFS